MSTDELAPGDAREIGPSLYDQLRADPIAPPDALLEETLAQQDPSVSAIEAMMDLTRAVSALAIALLACRFSSG